jgi:uncharacterized membrane protein YhaH (DUF805 family)
MRRTATASPRSLIVFRLAALRPNLITVALWWDARFRSQWMFRGALLSVQLDLISFRGRLARKPYWVGMGVLIGLWAVATQTGLEDTNWAYLFDLEDILVAALIGRRMRDFGWSPFWAWLGVAIVQIAVPIALLVARGSPSEAPGFAPDIPPAVENPAFILLFILIGVAGLIKGAPGANRYGPAPGGGAAAVKRHAGADEEDSANVDAIIARSLAARSAAAVKAETQSAPAVMALAPGPSRSAPPTFGKRRNGAD